MSALRVDRLAVPFGESPGLVNVAFTVAHGERLVIVGASGAGKTTLLRAIAGLSPLAEGRVEVAGRDVTGLPPEQRDTVYLHQTPLLFPHLSVFENVAFPLRVRGTSAGAVRERVLTLLGMIGLSALAARHPATLSGGQRHRVALARALAARPAVLLLDEPLAALDPTLRRDMRSALLVLQQAEQPGLLLVTHDFDDVGMLADRVAVLLDRRLVQIAPPATVFTRPASLAVARFLGIPNEIAGAVDADRMFVSPYGAWPVIGDAPAGPGPAVAVLRADALRLVAVADSAVTGRITAVRGRSDRATVVVMVEAGAAPIGLEVAVDAFAIPALETRHGIALEPRGLWVVPPAGAAIPLAT